MSSGESPDGAIERIDSGVDGLTAGGLVSALAAADRPAASRLIGVLMRRFDPLTRRIWGSVGGNPSDLPDFRQSVWIKLLDALPTLAQPAAFAGFFRQLALNHAHDEVRRHRRREGLFVPMDDEQMEQIPAEELASLDNAILVNSFLEALPERERQVLGLLFVQGLSSAEVAAALHLSEGAVRMTKSRGINKLRALFELETRSSPKKFGEG